MSHSNWNPIPALVLGSVLLLASCGSDDSVAVEKAPLSRGPGTTWVAIEPTQCLTNPWEQDWLERNHDDYSGYPKDPSRPGLEPEEIAIITEYYARQGVMVLETSTRPRDWIVCRACTCPEGHTMYLLVRDQDVETMIGLGYRVEAPWSKE